MTVKKEALEKYKDSGKQMVTCKDCGKTVRRYNLSHHKNTAFHQDAVKTAKAACSLEDVVTRIEMVLEVIERLEERLDRMNDDEF
ncbi:TPA_asm: oncoid2 [Capsaspora MELD virus 2]|nr:TPA_asm: oncoid2 [Capsaspora MELD virus 2]